MSERNFSMPRTSKTGTAAATVAKSGATSGQQGVPRSREKRRPAQPKKSA